MFASMFVVKSFYTSSAFCCGDWGFGALIWFCILYVSTDVNSVGLCMLPSFMWNDPFAMPSVHISCYYELCILLWPISN